MTSEELLVQNVVNTCDFYVGCMSFAAATINYSDHQFDLLLKTFESSVIFVAEAKYQEARNQELQYYLRIPGTAEVENRARAAVKGYCDTIRYWRKILLESDMALDDRTPEPTTVSHDPL